MRLQIIGDKLGKTRHLTITDSLDKGKTQHFVFFNVKNVGTMIGLRVEILGHDGWALDNITMENAAAERNYTFVFNDWLDKDRPYRPMVILSEYKGRFKAKTDLLFSL